MLGVILYHTAAAYSYFSPYWPVQDRRNFLGDGLRELLVVFIMPFFFFAAGYFVLPSLRKNSLLMFVWKKIKRLGIYWIFAVLIVIPFFQSKQMVITGGYFDYWINYLLSFRDAQVGPLISGQPNNMHFWFISLLLYVYKPSLPPLLWFGLLTFAVDFVFLLSIPDSNWVVIPNVLQFNLNQLPIMVLYFGFGMYAARKEWFMKNDIPLKLHHGLSVSLLFTLAYFLIGQEFFKNIGVSNTLSPALLFCFSFVRSFLLLSYLMTALSLANKYFAGKNMVLHELADVSYEIYLVHLYIVVAFQMLSAGFASVPVIVTIPAIFLASTGISYVLGKLTLHKFPKISAAVMFVLFLVMPVIFGPD
jgi:hypothetical protein